MAITIGYGQRRLFTRIGLGVGAILLLRALFGGSSEPPHAIVQHSVLERVTIADKTLDVQRLPFLQARMGRDERDDLLIGWLRNGVNDYWNRFQLPFISSKETSHLDAQVVRSAIDDLLSLNGWVAAACPTLSRPFGQNKREDAYDDLISANNLYYVAIIIHSADHFLVDQLAVIVQLARRLGHRNMFVSMLDYQSEDATPTLIDLCEAVLTLLQVPFRIRRIPGMTEDPSAAYYPLEEAYARNLALEPLAELKKNRHIVFHRVIWLKGFTCPNDILETIKVSQMNEAAMVCGMDWAEHNGFFIFSDRWRTRDIEGDQFRLSRSSSSPSAGPPRDKVGASRYAAHLPFQVFCCESGTHVVDPAQSYYRGISYRSATNFHNLSNSDPAPEWEPESPCMDSSQAYFCRDLWVDAAMEGGVRDRKSEKAEPPAWPADEVAEQPAASRSEALGGSDVVPTETKTDAVAIPPQEDEEQQDHEDATDGGDGKIRRRSPQGFQKAAPAEGEAIAQQRPGAQHKGVDADNDANVGSDFDAMPEADGGDAAGEELPPIDPNQAGGGSRWTVPNSDFNPARILVNPRCVTTYAGVSHAQLALDLFGPDKDDDAPEYARSGGKYVLEDWDGAPDSFVCQEQKQTGGRKAIKTQRRLTFSVYDEMARRRDTPQ
ncbi:Cryptococcal mannosyltransferase 1 [Tulasnella sp. 330]|nr:Cryptococcal mannosyltransferase 1 [Tulasnella sp. 330]KAG8875379.1 Cryptococcal mannosyltransferase 1 [Tulasnella sp. 331]KAG8876352.1 Cryptococcal mannosyltransferase 1 [Tulasnella sp. 332]